MKTSNKILLGLLVIVFTVPMFLAFGLKSKIKKGEFTTEKSKYYSSEYERAGTFAAFKVVKVVAPGPEFLRVKLHASDELKYKYYNREKNDTIIFSNSNDTLTIEYKSSLNIQDEEDMDRINDLYVDVHLPIFNNLVVDGAVVIFDSIPASSANMSVTLKNRGELKDDTRRSPKNKEVGKIKSVKKEQSVASNKGFEMPINFSWKRLTEVKVATIETVQLNIKEQLLDELTKGI